MYAFAGLVQVNKIFIEIYFPGLPYVFCSSAFHRCPYCCKRFVNGLIDSKGIYATVFEATAKDDKAAEPGYDVFHTDGLTADMLINTSVAQGSYFLIKYLAPKPHVKKCWLLLLFFITPVNPY